MSHQSPLSILDALHGVYYRIAKKNQWHFTYVSKGCGELIGYARDTFVNQPVEVFNRLIVPEDQSVLTSKFSQHPRDTSLNTLQYRVIDKDGNNRFLKDQFIREYSLTGELIAIEGLLYEVTYAATKDQLFQQLHAYKEAIDVNIISSMTNTEGIIIAANKNFCKVSKYSEVELIGQNHNIICSGYHPRDFFQNLWNTISSGRLWRGEIKNRAKDGSFYWVDSTILPVCDKNKKITGYLSLRSVITKRKEAEIHKENYVSALEQIAFSVSHRVRAPLCSIMGLTNILQHHHDLPEEVQAILAHMVVSTRKLDSLTRELSNLIHSGDLSLRQMNYNDSVD